ncbi:MAG TPA: 3-deoxy-D-manno-octulosonic acid transferase [Candidatus Acidoferrales bacterium]|nr:3-deoxy-D-manno-octulosonic acid transferase [Candidatus Acidoferrales bacterium]
MVYWLYNVALTLGVVLLAPLLPLFFLLRLRAVDGLAERLGFYAEKLKRDLAGARPVWLHAVSAGEVLSAACLVEEMRRAFPDRKIVVSSSTATGVQMAAKLPGISAAIYFPLDHPVVVRRALAAFDPRLVIFLETEIWPNYLAGAYRRGIPVLLLSGRISERSARRYRRFSRVFAPALRSLSALGMQTGADAQRMISLGVDPSRVVVTGNLKYDAPSANGNGAACAASLGAALKGRKVWVAGSTHDGEEEFALEAHAALQRRFPGLVLILAPRHPHRFSQVEGLLEKRRTRFAKKSQLAGRAPDIPDVVLLDSMGELAAFYALADAAFVGGSLVSAGGHNLVEPARLGKPVFFGPYVDNFKQAATEIARAGGGAMVRTKDDLVENLTRVLADPGVALAMGALARGAVERHRGALRKSMKLVSRYLE